MNEDINKKLDMIITLLEISVKQNAAAAIYANNVREENEGWKEEIRDRWKLDDLSVDIIGLKNRMTTLTNKIEGIKK